MVIKTQDDAVVVTCIMPEDDNRPAFLLEELPGYEKSASDYTLFSEKHSCGIKHRKFYFTNHHCAKAASAYVRAWLAI